jgi:uncharacterized membrane protein
MAVSSLPARSPQPADEAEPEDEGKAEDENEDEEGAMATLTAWKFETPTGADAVLLKLEQLQSRGLIELHDSAVVSWPEGRKKPWTRESESATGRGALGGGFWGLLFGLIFFVPLLGAAIGAATGALVGSLREVGISDDFIREVREKVTPGTSALFLLSSDAVYDKIAPELPDIQAELISTNMSEEQEAQLRQAFGLEADET